MRYKIIDDRVANLLSKFLTEEDIEYTLDKQFDDNTSIVIFYKENPLNIFNNIAFNIDKKYFKKIVEYNPKDWNKFSEVLPPNVFNFYLVFKKYPETNNFKYTVNYWDPENKKFTLEGNKYVVAYKEFKLFKE